MSRRGFAFLAAALLLAGCGGSSGDAEPGGSTGAGGIGGLGFVDGTGGGEEGGAGGLPDEGNTGGTEEPAGPVVESLVPDTGLKGTIVEIRGENLVATRELLVLFRGGGAQGRVLSVDPAGSWIRTVVPEKAEDGPVVLGIDGDFVQGPSFDVMDGNPVPGIERLRPDHVPAGTTEAVVRLEGWGFSSLSRFFLDEREVAPTSVSDRWMEVFLSADDLAVRGPRWLRVENPAPGGGTTEPVPLLAMVEFNVLRAETPSANQVRVLFDQPPSRAQAGDPRHYEFVCYT